MSFPLKDVTGILYCVVEEYTSATKHASCLEVNPGIFCRYASIVSSHFVLQEEFDIIFMPAKIRP